MGTLFTSELCPPPPELHYEDLFTHWVTKLLVAYTQIIRGDTFTGEYCPIGTIVRTVIVYLVACHSTQGMQVQCLALYYPYPRWAAE